MNAKRSLESCIRGWFPQEPSYPNSLTIQVSRKAIKHPNIKVYSGLFAAIFVTILLMVLTLDALGLESYGPIAAGGAVPVGVVVYVVLFKKPQRTKL